MLEFLRLIPPSLVGGGGLLHQGGVLLHGLSGERSLIVGLILSMGRRAIPLSI